MNFNIDRLRYLVQLEGVSASLVLKAIKQAVACCAPSGKVVTQDLSAFAPLFKALGDETRLRILGFLLAKQGTLCACEIEEHVKELSQPTISHHMRLLREAGLVTAERRGTWVYYAVDNSARERLLAFASLFAH